MWWCFSEGATRSRRWWSIVVAVDEAVHELIGICGHRSSGDLPCEGVSKVEWNPDNSAGRKVTVAGLWGMRPPKTTRLGLESTKSDRRLDGDRAVVVIHTGRQM